MACPQDFEFEVGEFRLDKSRIIKVILLPPPLSSPLLSNSLPPPLSPPLSLPPSPPPSSLLSPAAFSLLVSAADEAASGVGA